MLKRSDYVAIIVSFVAMLVFYLILAGNLSIDLGAYEQLNPILVPEDYDPVDAWEAAEPEIAVLRDDGSTEVEGVLLSERLLIQGQVYYDSLPCTVSKVAVDARCGKLMVEWSEGDREPKDMIPLIWENGMVRVDFL